MLTDNINHLLQDEIFRTLDPAIQDHIRQNSEQYAPLLALMFAWKQSVTTHLGKMEDRLLDEITQSIFPKGDWRFPAQTLAVPHDLLSRKILPDSQFQDLTTNTNWTACGYGHIRPSRIVGPCRVEGEGEQWALVCDIEYSPRSPSDPLLSPRFEDRPEQSQLAFIAAAEPLVAQLGNAYWAIQLRDEEGWTPISVSRYTGYLEFEMALASARLQQRQLRAWTPPFYPYSRKFLRFHLPGPPTAPPAAWDWLQRNDKEEKPYIRLAALLTPSLVKELEKQDLSNLLILNAFPVAQMQVRTDTLEDDPEGTGDAYRRSYAGDRHGFAAVAVEETQAQEDPPPGPPMHDEARQRRYHAARLAWQDSDPSRPADYRTYHITCDKPSVESQIYRSRFYFDCFGQKAARPTVLMHQQRAFRVPFPLAGGMDALIQSPEDPGARRFWYDALLRPTLLTEADVRQILKDIPAIANHFDLHPLQIVPKREPWPRMHPRDNGWESQRWQNYLWPSIVADQRLLESQADFLTTTRIALTPYLVLHFNPKFNDPGIPAFYHEDLARYAASVLSMHFMVGWYRIEGVVDR